MMTLAINQQLHIGYVRISTVYTLWQSNNVLSPITDRPRQHYFYETSSPVSISHSFCV